jgi:hypothetical protein
MRSAVCFILVALKSILLKYLPTAVLIWSSVRVKLDANCPPSFKLLIADKTIALAVCYICVCDKYFSTHTFTSICLVAGPNPLY